MICPKCGASVDNPNKSCNSCGASLENNGPVPQTTTGLAPNVCALLAYLLGWVSGLVLFFVEKDPFVRYHAAQSIIFFGGLHIIYQILQVAVAFAPFYTLFVSIAYIIYAILGCASFVLWIILMIKAYQGKRFEIPVVGALAQRVQVNFTNK